jgi:CRISPR/Cas system-associated exonuclease Cas4 (RecB family)
MKRLKVVGSIEIDMEKPSGHLSVVDLICPYRAWRAARTPIADIIKDEDINIVIGIVTHRAVLRQLEQQGCEVEVEMPIAGRKFRADAVCEEDGEKVVVEVKKRVIPGTVITEQYKMQVKMYMAFLGVRRGVIIGLNGVRIDIAAGEEELRELREVAETSLLYLDSDSEPPRRRGEHCRFCPFKNECINARLI